MAFRQLLWGLPDLLNPNVVTIRGRPGRADRRNNQNPEPRTWKALQHLLKNRRESLEQTIKRVEDLLFSPTYLEDEGNWGSVRPLGKGGYGVAALFNKRDSYGNIIDEIVIKSTRVHRPLACPQYPHLSKEAALMAQLNNEEDINILYLRNFKYFPDLLSKSDDGKKEGQWRYYLEVCPHQDLEVLRVRYKAWQQPFPEEFIWHVFKALMTAAQTMEYGNFDPSEVETNFEGRAFMLHCDVKPHNIFLGQKERDDEFGGDHIPNYPIPKLADFGLAALTSLRSDVNSPMYFQRGTALWYPPETRIKMFQKYKTWSVPPFLAGIQSSKHPRSSAAGMSQSDILEAHTITSAHNIWALGAVMFQLLTLAEASYLSHLVDGLSESQIDPVNGDILLDVKARPDDPSKEYSKELRDLVRACIRIYPEKRPTATQALEVIHNFMQKHYDSKPGDVMPPGPKVFYKANDINNMPVGPLQIYMDDNWWRNVFNGQEAWQDERWPRLQPPGRPYNCNPWNMVLKRPRPRSSAYDAGDEEEQTEEPQILTTVRDLKKLRTGKRVKLTDRKGRPTYVDPMQLARPLDGTEHGTTSRMLLGMDLNRRAQRES